nr:hypothetical protein [Tanacetum cinerariifolium]
MADMNIPSNDAPAKQAPAVAPSTRTDDQILPSSKWVPIGKSNCVLDFGDTMCFNSSTGLYSCQLDEQWFVRKDSKEIYGMPIPDALLTDEIKGAPYYGEYQEHVAKNQQYMDAEHGKAEEGGATESKATKGTKTKAAKATKPAGDKASMLTSTQPPKPKLAPTQPSKAIFKKKRKLVKETPDEPSPAKRSKGGLVEKNASLEAHS